MDFIQSSVTRSFGLSTGTIVVGEGSGLSSDDNQRARPVGSSQTNMQLQQPLSHAQIAMKSSRTSGAGAAGHAFLPDLDDGDIELGGPLKLSRKELYNSCRQSEFSAAHWASASGAGNGSFALLRGAPNSFMAQDDHYSPWSSSSNSPTSAYNSSGDGVLHGGHSYLMGDPRFLPRAADCISPTSPYACSPRDRLFRPFYPHQYSSSVCGNRSTSLFTASQWAELEDQALIFKYMMTGSSVPPHLLGPILKSLSTIRGFSSLPYHPSSVSGWGNFYPGVASNPDPEPGRCRRTDGKKWRCAREAVPDQKYCDRHIHRGRNRSRKLAESQALSSSTSNSHSSGAVSSLTAASSSHATTPACASAAQRTSALEHAHGCITRQTSTIAPTQQLFSSFANRNSQLNNPFSEHVPQQYFLPFQSSTGEAAAPIMQMNKEYHSRYDNGGCKDNTVAAMCSEQLFFSELGCRDQPSPAQATSNRSCMQNRPDMFRSSLQGSLRQSFPHTLSSAPQHDQASSLTQQYSTSQRRNDSVEFSGITDGSTEADQMTIPHESQQKSNFLGSEYGAANLISASKEQPLRHFFDDWPRDRDPSTISWMDQSEDQEKSIRSAGCGTQLSISIPMTSSDSPLTGLSPSRDKPTPLTLSMSRPVEDKQMKIKLDMGMGLGMQDHQDRHRHLASLPISWEAAAPVGGPLAEMLQSSNNTPRGSGKQSSGLNLLCEGWESSPRDNTHNQPTVSSRSSPSAVLQNTGATASNGSCCSSPHGS